MRGVALAILALCGNCLAQKVEFVPADKATVLQRAMGIPESDQEREDRIKAWFAEAGCNGNSLQTQAVENAVTPNIICKLRGNDDKTVVVGAHYDRVASASRPIDNWSGASLLPALYHSLRGTKRRHTFLFVAFADQGNDLAGASSFTSHLSPSDARHIEAMVNLDSLGFSPTKVWASHSDKELVHDLVMMVYALKLPASQAGEESLGGTDSGPFDKRKIPNITIHSLTQQNLNSETTQFRPDNFYDTYRLLCGYLAYLDKIVKPRPHPE